MNSETTLSARLKEAVGVNVSAFARKSGVGESLLRQYIAGSKPGIDKAAAIAQAAGVSLEWLATGAAPKLLSGIEKPVNLNEQPATYPYRHWPASIIRRCLTISHW